MQGSQNNCWFLSALQAIVASKNGPQFIMSLFDLSGQDVRVTLPGSSSCHTVTKEEAREIVDNDNVRILNGDKLS